MGKSILASTGLPATPAAKGDFRIWVRFESDGMQGEDDFLPNVPYWYPWPLLAQQLGPPPEPRRREPAHRRGALVLLSGCPWGRWCGWSSRAYCSVTSISSGCWGS
ncbi:MAG: hypothetical protein HC915_20540 [Anaerolineae bacterium]|nr:hypothetical protein [Anaerolineae bacterium]